jgi:hypothetical protein
MAILSPSEIVTISVSNPPAGLAPYSVNNLLVLTKDTPVVPLTGSFEVYTNPADVLTQWGSDSKVYEAALAIFAQSPNIISGGGKLLVAPMLEAELLDAAITRLSALVYFGGVGFTFAETAGNILTAGTAAQAARKKLFVGSATATDLTDGLLYDIQDQGLTRARGLYHSDADELAGYVWAYASQAQSTDFSGVNTTRTMHLKQLAGVPSDEGLTSTVVANAQACGADVYGSIAGRASLLTSGANGFYDDVYNLDAFVADLEVAGFNALAQAGTKVPQTEAGMTYLKDAYRKVCEKYVANGFIGAGTWTGTGTFGDPEVFRRSIQDNGFYIYSLPLSQQTQADREDRKAPLVMIAIKYQGAIHSTSVMVNINR